MASVFLANAPYFLEERYGKLASVGATLPHLGLLMLAAALHKEGHRVRVLDASAQGWGYDETLADAKKFKPDIIALTAVTPSILKTVKLAELFKKTFPSVPVIIGGAHFTAVPEETLTVYPVFDYGVVGEGDITLVELVDALSAQKTLTEVAGLAVRQNGKIIFTAPRPPVADLDTLPFPAWELLDDFPSYYRPGAFKYKKLPSTHIVSARGCPNRCVFCDTSVFNRRIRYHSPEYVLKMVGHLVEKFGIREIIFEDDQFLIQKDRVARICEGFLAADWKIAWSCSGRVNSVKDLDLLRLMKRSGCWQINYGIESGNQKILDSARKGITIKQIETAVRLTHRAGILSKGYFILGLPGETEKSIQETIDFVKRIPLNDVSVFILTPFPGSEMHKLASRFGTLDNNYEKMNLLDVVYVPAGLSRDKLLHYQRRFMRDFYLRPKIFGNYMKRLVENPLNSAALFKAFWGFLAFTFKFRI